MAKNPPPPVFGPLAPSYLFRRCTDCGVTKRHQAFYLRRRPDGSQVPMARCQVCTRAANGAWQEDNRDYAREYKRRPEVKRQRSEREGKRRRKVGIDSLAAVVL